jgi:CBS domain containing-hemolysin-like protein
VGLQLDPSSSAIGFATCAVLFAFFALVLATLNATDNEKLEKLAGLSAPHRVSRSLLGDWLEDRHYVAAVLQLGQTLTGLAMGAFAVQWANSLFVATSTWLLAGIGLAIGAAGVLLVGNLLPRTLAAWRPDAFIWALLIAGLPFRVLRALRRALDAAARVLVSALGGDPKHVDRLVTREDLESLLRSESSAADVDPAEKELLESVLEFRELRVKEVMVPRTDARFVDVESNLEEILELIRSEGYSRYPVYRETVDNVVGILVVKDIIAHISGQATVPFRIDDHLRPSFFVPESKLASEVLRELQRRKSHLAVVIDEFGGTAGLVSMEDVLEAVVGDIFDEHDEESDEPGVEKRPDGTLVVDARVLIRDLEDELDFDFPEDEEYDSLGGFVVKHASRVPAAGYEFHWNERCFRVTEADATRVRKVEISRIRGVVEAGENAA